MSPATRVSALRREAAECRRCPLWENATQTVFGEGRTGGMMLVGEQPGDVEDRAGHPFVGPAGRLLREVLGEAGISPEDVYLTNAVKHFKWAVREATYPRQPNWSEIDACGHWLGLELRSVRPALVVCLGATAAGALFGRTARVGELRGHRLELDSGLPALVTIHPSAVLRADDQREARRAELLSDLELAHDVLEELGTRQRSKTAKS